MKKKYGRKIEKYYTTDIHVTQEVTNYRLKNGYVAQVTIETHKPDGMRLLKIEVKGGFSTINFEGIAVRRIPEVLDFIESWEMLAGFEPEEKEKNERD